MNYTPNKNSQEIIALLLMGATLKVKLNDRCTSMGEYGLYGDEGMICDVRFIDGLYAIQKHIDSTTYLLTVDFTNYMEHNILFERSDWNGRDGREGLTYLERCAEFNEPPGYNDIEIWIDDVGELMFEVIS